jgi:hypothetical protein
MAKEDKAAPTKSGEHWEKIVAAVHGKAMCKVWWVFKHGVHNGEGPSGEGDKPSLAERPRTTQTG